MSQTLLWDNCPSLPSLLEPNVRDNQLWLKGTDYEAQAELGAVMIAKPETEFITEWCVMYDTERCNASTPCSRRLQRENWSVTSELCVLSVTAGVSTVRLSPGVSEQWAVVAPGSRHHRPHPGADGTWEHRRQHRLSQGEGGWSRGKQRPKVYMSICICCQLSSHIIKLVSESFRLKLCQFVTITIYFSKKWKKLLTFPHISECIDLVSSLRADNYDYIVGEQPIGNKLFRQFCQSNKKLYTHYNDFLDDVDNYETVLEENRTHEAQKIFTEYLSKPLGKFSFKDIKPRCASKNRWTYI